MVAHCVQSAPSELLARVHDRHRIWTRFELAKGAQDRFLVAVTRSVAVLRVERVLDASRTRQLQDAVSPLRVGIAISAGLQRELLRAELNH